MSLTVIQTHPGRAMSRGQVVHAMPKHDELVLLVYTFLQGKGLALPCQGKAGVVLHSLECQLQAGSHDPTWPRWCHVQINKSLQDEGLSGQVRHHLGA